MNYRTPLPEGQYANLSTGRKLLEQVSDAIRFKHYSYRTERTYQDWIERCLLFHGKRRPKDSVILFLDRHVLHLESARTCSLPRCGRS
jgi:hypothetical protein